MRDIFADLYNKVLSFFNKTDEKTENAKDVACNRLKLVLMQDRTNLTPAIMDRMRRELIDLLSKYLELDRELLDLSFEHEDEQMALMLSIPVIRAKSEEEIQAILDAEDEANKESDEADESDEDDSDENDDYKSESDDNENKDADDNESSDENESEESDSDNNDEDNKDEEESGEDNESDDDESDDEDDDDESPDEVKKEKFFKEKKSKSKKE